MTLKNTPTKFGLIAKSFHWIMAVLILMMLTMGYKMVQLPAGPDKVWVVLLHKSLGILILMLACGRLAWRFASPRPGPEPSLKPWEDKLARLVHFLLYVAFFAMPLTGWIMSSAGQYPVKFFGLFDMPQIVPKSREIMSIARDAHGFIATAFLVLLFLHLSGAAKHHVIDRDNTLRRMTWDRLSYGMGILLLAVAGLVYLLPIGVSMMEEEDVPAAAQQSSQALPQGDGQSHQAPRWDIDQSASYIKFQVTQSGQPFEGEFKRFGAHIFFDPENLAGSFVDVNIGIGGTVDGGVPAISTGSSDRDQQALSSDWFNVKDYPLASFLAELFERPPLSTYENDIKYKDESVYLAHGILTVRGVSKKIDLLFVLDIHDKTAQMYADITLNRLDFGIGQGEWQKTDTIANEVKISIYVKAASAVE